MTLSDLIVIYCIALFVVLLVCFFVGEFFLNKFKKENPSPANYEWIKKEQTKYWKIKK